jgi:diguanylate cyclase (GGDEF)-like protein/PAS domain S-box-containing protein
MATGLPAALAEGLLRLARGELGYRLPLAGTGDPDDLAARVFNDAADGLERTVALSRQAEQRLEQNLRRLLDAAPVALLLIDPADHRIISANQRAAQILEATEEELKGRPAPAIHLAVGAPEPFFDRLRREEAVDGVTAQVETATGRLFWALLDARALDQDGRSHWMLGIADITEQKRTEERLRELATTDPLTGALNRRQLFELAEEEVRRAERYGRPLCFSMLDLDHFKAVNDRFGHAVGDEALRAVAASIRRSLRATDRLARHGGEEFVVMLPETPLSTARGAIERIRTSVEALRFEAKGEPVSITVSAGVVAWRSGESVDAVLDRADGALYEAKRAGRNRVVASGDVGRPPPASRPAGQGTRAGKRTRSKVTGRGRAR